MRATVAVLRLRTQTAPSLAAIDAGSGVSSPGRSAIAIGFVTRLVAGSIRRTLAVAAADRPHGAGADRDAVERHSDVDGRSARECADRSRTRFSEPSVTHTPPAPAAIDGAIRAGALGRCVRAGTSIGGEIVVVARDDADELPATAVGHPHGAGAHRDRAGVEPQRESSA